MTAVFVPCADTAQVSLQFQQADGSFAENTLWFTQTSTFTATQLSNLAGEIAGWWSDGTAPGADLGLKHLTSHDCSLVQVTARDMSTQNGPVVTHTAGLPEAGTDSGAQLTLGLTKAITLRTGLAGRAYRGRFFIVGMPVDSLSDTEHNIVATSYTAAVLVATAGMSYWLGTLDPSPEWVVASRFHVVGGQLVPREAGIMTPIISQGVANQLVDFQRRRAPGHNRHR